MSSNAQCSCSIRELFVRGFIRNIMSMVLLAIYFTLVIININKMSFE